MPVTAPKVDAPITEFVQPQPTTLRLEESVGEALARLRSSTLANRIVYFFVVDDQSRLRGVVPTRRLLGAPLEASVGEIMIDRLVKLPSVASVGEALKMFVAHKLLALPVVDDGGRLMGVVDVGQFDHSQADVSQREGADTVFQMLGLHLANSANASSWARFADRFPWLLANVGGGLLCALISAQYESLLEVALVLALFIPVVLAVSESVSMQSTTLTLEGIVTGLSPKLGAALLREFKVAVMLGAMCGGLVGGIAFVWQGQALVALTIGVSILMSMLTACLMGVALPSLVHHLRLDPNVAAGPVTLALVDVATLMLYFNIGGQLLG